MPVIKTKLLLFLLFIFLLCGKGFGQFKTSAFTLDAQNNESWYKTFTNYSCQWSIGWDNDSLYLYKQNTAISNPVIIYFDIDPIFPVTWGTNSNGAVVGTTDYGITANLPFRADARIYWNSSACEIRNDSSGVWGYARNISRNFLTTGTIDKRELAVAWTTFGISGRPNSFNFFGYSIDISGCKYIFDQFPIENAYGCLGNPNMEFYWTVINSSSSGTSNPLDYKSYTYLGTGGNLDSMKRIHDFTLNKSGVTVNKTGNWRFSGRMAVSDGKILFRSNRSDSLTVADSMVVMGTGEIDLDTSSSPIWAKGNLGIRADSTSNLKLSTSTASKLIVGGTFYNYNSLSGNKTKVIMKASSGQTIKGYFKGNSALNKLEIDNGNSVTLNLEDSLCIKDSLIMLSGTKLNTSSNSLIRLRNNAKTDSLLYTSNAYVDGPMLWETFGTDERIFPIGDGGQFKRIGITPTNSYSGRIYKAEYFKSPYSNITNLVTYSTPLDRVSQLEYWDLDETSSASGSNVEVKVKLFWNTFSSVSTAAADRANLRVCHWNSTKNAWERVTNPSSFRDEGASNGNVMGDTAISVFSSFTLGTLVSNNLLPVTLTKFYALKNSSEVTLHWQTASEVNCNYFEVWKSNDGINYSYLTTKKGKGNTSQLSNYMAADANPHKGYTYYKLMQYDFNGTMEVFGPIVILQAEQNELVIFPNPANTYVEISTIDNIHLIRFELFDQKGKRIKEVNSFLSQIRTDDLPSGIYLVKAIAQNGRQFSSKLSIIR